MTIAPDLVARILRLHTVEKWRVGTIARQLHVHHGTVRRVIARRSTAGPDVIAAGADMKVGVSAGVRANTTAAVPATLRASRIDPYRPFLLQTLTQYPTLTAARLHAMACERGYVGSASHFRALIAQLRPRPAAEAYLRLRTLPGEQAQVDWAHFGHLQIGRARRPLMAF